VIDSLLKDKDFEIVGIVERIRDGIVKGEIWLKEKKKKRILFELNKMNKNYFENFLTKYEELNEILLKVSEEISNIDAVERLEKMKKNLEISKNKLREDKEKIAKLSGDLSKINVEELREELKKKFLEKIENIKII
jgi:hypothetical protein